MDYLPTDLNQRHPDAQLKENFFREKVKNEFSINQQQRTAMMASAEFADKRDSNQSNCKVCNRPAFLPQQCSNCGNLICEHCVNSSSMHEAHGLDCDSLALRPLNKKAQGQIDRSQLVCKMRQCAGYDQPAPYQTFVSQHYKIHFSNQTISCPLKCRAQLTRNNAESHLLQCPSNVFTCTCEGQHFLAQNGTGQVLMPPGQAPIQQQMFQAPVQPMFQAPPLPEYGDPVMNSPPVGAPLVYDNTALTQDFDRQKRAYEQRIHELETQLKKQIQASNQEVSKMKSQLDAKEQLISRSAEASRSPAQVSKDGSGKFCGLFGSSPEQKLKDILEQDPEKDNFSEVNLQALQAWRQNSHMSLEEIKRKTTTAVMFLNPIRSFTGTGWISRGQLSSSNQLHGVGRLMTRKLISEGQFENGRLNGYGRTFEDGGQFYIGQYKDGQRHGQGKLFLDDGKIKEGKFKDDDFLGS